jgi:phosphoribosyl 1,2-cyclic phosphate phosphodiesterase
VESAGKRILVDTPPEIRLQLVKAGVASVDAVLFTHEHADHVHGIDDLRAVSVSGGTLPVYGPGGALREIERRFAYIFDGTPAPDQSSKPDLAIEEIEPGTTVPIAGMPVQALQFDHGRMNVFGYRFGRMAYLTDVKRVSGAAIEALTGLDLLVINALFEKPHPAHLSIPEAIDVARAVGAKRTVLTHLTHRYSHAHLVERLPEGVEPAYDGLVIDLAEG